MLFNSTYPDNLKRRTIQKELGRITLNKVCDYLDLNQQILKLAQKAKIENKEIKCYNSICNDEYNGETSILVVYYETPETDEEYKKRISELERTDIKDFLHILGRYNTSKRVEKKLKKVFARQIKKYPHLVPDWQKEQVAEFFGVDKKTTRSKT
jgi:hypothetical protein